MASPIYGTCLNCVQPQRIRTNGTLVKHNRKRVVQGVIVATVYCIGGYTTPAETLHLTWDAALHKWVSND